jgi:hypothetical protein
VKFFTRALLLALLLASVPAIARNYAADWTLFPEPVNVVPLSVQIHAPKAATTSHEVELALFIGIPVGCYKTDIKVEHRDDHTHVLRPVLYAGTAPCVQVSRFDAQRVSLGYLPVGEHKVIVENVTKPGDPVMFWVTEGDSLATH